MKKILKEVFKVEKDTFFYEMAKSLLSFYKNKCEPFSSDTVEKLMDDYCCDTKEKLLEYSYPKKILELIEKGYKVYEGWASSECCDGGIEAYLYNNYMETEDENFGIISSE